MSLKIYLIRHGETDFNRDSLEWGQNNQTSLNKQGVIQSKKLAERLKAIHFNKLFYSNLKRAIQTADEISNVSSVKIFSDERLREYEPGNVDPSSEKWNEKYNEILKSGITKYEIRPFGGENIWDLIKRVKSFLQDIQKEEGVIGVIAHSGVNSVFINLSQGREKSDFVKIKQDNTCINILEFSQNKWKIESINDSEHINYLLPKKEIYKNQKEIKEKVIKYTRNKLANVSKKIYLGGDLITEMFGFYDRPYKRYKGSTIETYAMLNEDFKIPPEWKLSSLLNEVKKYEIGNILVGNVKHKVNLTLMDNQSKPEETKVEEIYSNNRDIIL